MIKRIEGTRFIAREFHPLDQCDVCHDDIILHDWLTMDGSTVLDCDRK